MPHRLRALRVPLALLALSSLVACSAAPPEDLSQAGAGSAATPPVPGQAAAEAGQPVAPQAPGLIPLPSPQAVLGQVPIGRTDPFAPLQGPPPAAAPINLPAGFRLRGVLRVAGRDQAFVQSAAGSGVVCLGPQGRCSAGSDTPLPRGTAVVSIQPRLGCITVAASGQRQRYCLQES